MLGVPLTKEFLGEEKLLPALEDLRAEPSFVVRPRGLDLLFIGEGCSSGMKELTVWP